MAELEGTGPWTPPGASTVDVETRARTYRVIVGPGLLGHIGRLVRDAVPTGSARAFLAWDEGLPAPTVGQARQSLAQEHYQASDAALSADEGAKTLETVDGLLRALAEAKLERTDPVIALGGGIVGDVAGFAGAAYRRGVPVIQCPTTLLAMVDASVGGKTGVNLDVSLPDGGSHLLKNLVGAFHQPHLVVADTGVLASLAERDFLCGLAECVKHAMIGGSREGADLFDWLESHVNELLARDPATVRDLVVRNVRIKARFVALDEREEATPQAGGRMLLNLGHTFAHAIETIEGAAPHADPRLAPLRHGEAVALGLRCACRCAATLGLCERTLEERVLGLLTMLRLPITASGLPPGERVIEAMRYDKKAGSGRMRVVLPVELGTCRVVENPEASSLRSAIDAIRD